MCFAIGRHFGLNFRGGRMAEEGPNFDLCFESSNDDSIFITKEPSQNRVRNRNLHDEGIVGLNLESLMDTSSESAIESVENFQLDVEDEPGSVLEVDIPKENNVQNDNLDREIYKHEVEEISDDDGYV